jgi:hypothetical protein
LIERILLKCDRLKQNNGFLGKDAIINIYSLDLSAMNNWLKGALNTSFVKGRAVASSSKLTILKDKGLGK